MTRRRRSSALWRDLSRRINATEQRSRTRTQPGSASNSSMLIPVSSRSSRLKLLIGSNAPDTDSMSAVGPSAKSCDVPVCHATITYCGAACRFTLRKTATATPHKRTKMAMAASVIGASLRFCASNNCCASLTCRSACSTCRFSSS
jgi:hypothetical protein